jgi:hypothetical protein
MKKLALIFILLFVVGCNQQQAKVAGTSMPSSPMLDRAEGGAEQSLTKVSEPKISVDDVQLKKYIALAHFLTVETVADKMQANFDATAKHCEALNCQILSASFNRKTAYNPPFASLHVRVPPRNIEIFLSGLAQHSDVRSHARHSEDKTSQVIDTDAQIKNLTHLRDRLRTMLSDKTATFKDIIEIESALANTQSKLDSMTRHRKTLSLETDWVAVNIDFLAKQGITESGFFAPIARALSDSGRVVIESFANVVTFLMIAIPWLLMGIPALIVMRKYWAKIKTKLL